MAFLRSPPAASSAGSHSQPVARRPRGGPVFTVNTTADTSDIFVPLNGGQVRAACVDAAGNCSLRGALEYTNFGPNAGGSHTIIVPAGLYVLSSGTSLQAGDQAASTTIQGAGAGSTIIDGNNNGFPAIVVNTPDGTWVTIDGVTPSTPLGAAALDCRCRAMVVATLRSRTALSTAIRHHTRLQAVSSTPEVGAR